MENGEKTNVNKQNENKELFCFPIDKDLLNMN